MLKTPREVCDLKAPKKTFKNDKARVEWLRDVKKIKFVKDHKGRLMVPWGEQVKMIQGNHHLVDETTADEYATAQALVQGIRGGRVLKALLAMFDLWAMAAYTGPLLLCRPWWLHAETPTPNSDFHNSFL